MESLLLNTAEAIPRLLHPVLSSIVPETLPYWRETREPQRRSISHLERVLENWDCSESSVPQQSILRISRHLDLILAMNCEIQLNYIQLAALDYILLILTAVCISIQNSLRVCLHKDRSLLRHCSEKLSNHLTTTFCLLSCIGKAA